MGFFQRKAKELEGGYNNYKDAPEAQKIKRNVTKATKYKKSQKMLIKAQMVSSRNH